MVVHFHAPRRALEKTVRFVARSITNAVACIEDSAIVTEDLAWETVMEGTLDAFAERLARDKDGIEKAFELGDVLAARVSKLQQKAALPA